MTAEGTGGAQNWRQFRSLGKTPCTCWESWLGKSSSWLPGHLTMDLHARVAAGTVPVWRAGFSAPGAWPSRGGK